MLSKINPTQTQAWSKLVEHHADVKATRMKTLFANNPDRFEKMSIQFNEIIFDYSKNIITDETKKYLLELVDECDLKPAIEAMFNGEKINETENRAVRHTALRNCSDTSVMLDGSYLKRFKEAGANILSIHLEACPRLPRTVDAIKKY